jgi:very-short-patch-repair endonuclease
VTEVAERQWGVISRRQLEEAGLGSAAVTRWMEDGRIHRLHRSVYAVGHRRLPIEGQLFAALLYAGEGSALSHTTAAWWWGPSDLEPVTHRGLPVTDVPRTLLDLASSLEHHHLRRALAEAEFRGLLQLEEAAAALGRGHPGSAALRRALARHLPELALTRSVLEERLLALCEQHALPIPEINEKIGPFTVDALWRDARLVVEVDGGPAHTSRARMKEDRHRDLVLRGLGYRVQRYTWAQVTREAAAVAADVWDALRRR